jgi:hypothetical protein
MKDFIKSDSNKLRYDLVPPSLIEDVARVLTFGAEKYEPNNWKRVDDPSRYVAALYRHLEAWRAGEITDQESRLSHLAHAATNIAFLIELNYQPEEWVDKFWDEEVNI